MRMRMSNTTVHNPSATSPALSVAMSVYNGERFLVEAIDSILAQTFTDFELLVLDDGSTDGTADILHSYAARDAREQDGGRVGPTGRACAGPARPPVAEPGQARPGGAWRGSRP